MSVKPVPYGFHTITPYLVVSDAAKLLDFLQSAFGAEVLEKMTLPNGTVNHAIAQVGDSILMMGTANPENPPIPSMLYLYVADVDAWYKKALAAGATSLHELKDEFYGDRVGAVKDMFGHQWWIATHIKDMSHEELQSENEKARAQKE